ncbi:MAG: hypothetical protein DRP09_15970 [Candidatus Thorarchaeota archaeon]|nr:MAG: hypothetical protein DRP09_15970 [Candidatus Thorarchaeota archaeon]
MAKTVSDVLSILLTRLRADGGVAYDNTTLLIPLLSRVQRTLNARLRRVLASGTFITSADTLIYTIRDQFPDAVDIIKITSGGRTLHKMKNWREYADYDTDWFKRTGTRFESYAQIGRDLLIIYPALSTADSVEITYSKITDELTKTTDTFELYDEDIDLVILLMELICLIHQRLFVEFKKKLPFFTKALKNHLLVLR